MFLPYSTDLHDGKIGIVTFTIIAACTFIHLIIWIHDRSITPELYQVISEAYTLDTVDQMNKIQQQLFAEMDEKNFNEYMQAKADSIKSQVDVITQRMWVFKWAFVPSEKNFLKIFTSMFIHLDWMHLIGNMLFFYVCAVSLERFWGAGRFTLFYLLSGLGAGLLYLLYGHLFISSSQWQDIRLVGASGAISGTIGALLMRYPKNKVYIFYWFWRRTGVFTLPVYMYFGLWTLEQIFFILTDSEMKTGTAFSAHLGGLITGILFGLTMKSDETVFETSSPRTRGVRKKFVMLDEGGCEPVEPEALLPEQQQPQRPLFEQGLDALYNGDIQNATVKMVSGIDLLFANPLHNKPEIDMCIKKFLAASSQLAIECNIVYQWGKKLLEIDLQITAIHCFDLVSKTTRNKYLFLNSLLYASDIRIRMNHQIEHAKKSLLYLIEKYPQEVQSREAQRILAGIQ